MPTSIRVYAGLTPADLATLREHDVVDLAGRGVHAATDRVRRAFPDDDEEDLEYAALWNAAEAMVAAGHARVVVAAADVAAGWVSPVAPDDADDPELAYRLDLDRPLLPRSAVVSLHVAAVGAGPDDELLWHDISELDAVAQTC